MQREHVRWRAETETPVQPRFAAEPALQAPQLRLFATSPSGSDDTAADNESSPAAVRPIAAAPVESGRAVQHLGSWIMMALAYR